MEADVWQLKCDLKFYTKPIQIELVLTHDAEKEVNDHYFLR